MKIPFSPEAVEAFPATRGIREGPFKEKACHYQAALYETLRTIKPRRCLEIGTHMGESAAVFQRYFDEECPDGLLVTVDIERWIKLPKEKFPNVRQAILPAFDPRAVWKLTRCVERDDDETGLFDFAFIDGDHSQEAFLHDIMLAFEATLLPHHMLLDDVRDEIHPCARTYRTRIIPHFETEEFDDWMKNGCLVGAALVWHPIYFGAGLPRRGEGNAKP